jgi:ABC-2 type transport system permease protein
MAEAVIRENRRRAASGHAWLVVQLALKDFKIRYTHSVLGYTWSVLSPLAFFIIYYTVFTFFVRLEIGNYAAFLLLGVVLWNFFYEGTGNGAAALVTRADLVTKTAINREVFVFAALVSAGLTFVINLFLFLGLLGLMGIRLHLPALCFPLLVFDLLLLTLGIALFLAPLQARFRDVGYLWGIILQVGFWLTPILYLDLMMPERWRWLVWINPIGRIIGDSRRVLVYGLWPGGRGLVLTTLMSITICILGFVVFRRLQARAVEHL